MEHELFFDIFHKLLHFIRSEMNYVRNYNSSVRIIDLVFYTTNDRFFENFFMAILFTLRVFARNLLEGNSRKNTFFSNIRFSQ